MRRAERTALALHRFGNDDICEPVRGFDFADFCDDCSVLSEDFVTHMWTFGLLL
eukprot:COSAG04_NODE_618_length_11896_cov_81.925659_17_plen_54_part_00